MEVVSFRVSRELKKKMEELSHVNWSEVVRRAIAEEVARQEALRIDRERALRALLELYSLRQEAGGWDSLAEIKKWRRRS
ncbi:MAG: hypothetical protein ABWK05_00420 [Pyrobaculum sp.]